MHDAAFGMLRADFFEKGGIFVWVGCGRGRGFFGSLVIIIQICDRKRAIKMIDIIHDDVHRHNPDSVFLCQLSRDIRAAFSRKDYSAHVIPPSPMVKYIIANGLNLLVPIYHTFSAQPKSVMMASEPGREE